MQSRLKPLQPRDKDIKCGLHCIDFYDNSTLTKNTGIGIVRSSLTLHRKALAEVVKLVDTLASGASGGNPVEVQVLSSAPTN